MSWRENAPHFADIPEWPVGVLPLFDWGDAIWSCVDTKTTTGAIVTHDNDVGATPTDFTIVSWLDAWSRGVNLWREIYDEGQEEPLYDPRSHRTIMVRARPRARPHK
jgi:hypothetical protein